MIVAPSLLACPLFAIPDFLQSLEKSSLRKTWIHLDIMDGHFVPNLTYGYDFINAVAEKTSHPLDAHFMVSNPEQTLELLRNSSASFCSLTFHWEAILHHDRFIQAAKKLFPKTKIGVALNPSTSFELIPHYLLEELDIVLLMSVNPGFSHQSFIPGVLPKIERARQKRAELGANFLIEIDGGINQDNLAVVKKAGADVIVAGGAVFGKGIGGALEQIETLQK